MAFLQHLPELWSSFKGSKPVPPPKANGHVTNGPTHKPPPLSTTIPHSNCVNLPHSRKMIVLREYLPQDNRGLAVKGGDSVQVIQKEGRMVLVRNEYGKEGLVPDTHLFAPYTSTRTRKPSNPIRPVASGSSVHELEPKGVPMYPSHSAGRPRHYGMENGDSGINGSRRSTLPANATSITHNDFSSSSCEQKYSPSSSSGVATGPSSPSLQQSVSQENFPHDSSSNSSSSSSFSSVEEEQDRRRYPDAVQHHQFESGIARNAGPLSSEETLTRFEGRATSDSNLSGRKVRPLPTPPPHRNQEGGYLSQPPSHIYSTIGEDIPPPIPPRNIPTTNSANDTYANPIDAISQDSSSHHSHEWVPHNRVKNLPEIWSRDEDQQYSTVFNGPVTPSRRQPSRGEPDSDSNSSRRSSKKNSQRNRIREKPFLEEEEEIGQEGDHGTRKLRSQTKISKFRKCLWGLYMVTADFEAFDENEVTIFKGEHVSVWNQDDREWYWIVKHASNHTEEGFVPSCYLREISSDSKQAHSMELVPQDVSPLPNGGSPMRLHPSQVAPPLEEVPRHRPPSGLQERRSASVRRRSSFGSTGGGRRARLHSDSSVRSDLQAKTPSATSIEKMDFPESPPSSPPPPYSEIDHNGHNFPRFTLSQHSEVRPGVYGTQMHRTRSHGQVTATTTHLTRPRLNTVSAMPRGGGGGNSQEMYHQPAVAVAGGSGTLV